MNKKTRDTLVYFIIPLVGLIFLYWLAGRSVSILIFHQPAPQMETLIKYSISLFADWIDLPFMSFSFPKEYEMGILTANPNLPRTLLIKDYHICVDSLPKPIFYQIFPYYALATTLLCLIWEKYQQITQGFDKPEAKREDVYIRGVRHIAPKPFCKQIKELVDDPAAEVKTNGGTLVFSGNRLREHMSIFGASGSGKSQFLLAFLSSFFANKSSKTRVIIVDRKGEFYAHFGRKTDILYNPFDARSVKWSIFNELDIPENFDKIPPDISAIAKILFPLPSSGDTFWQDASEKFFCSAMAVCIRKGKTKNQDLVNFCNQDWSDIVSEIDALPPGLDTGRVISANATTGGSILSTAQNGVQKLSVCPDGDFSIRNWLHHGKGNLFLSSAGKNDNVFIPILSLFIDLIGREIKEMPDSGAGGVRYLIVIDELAAYPAMQTLHYLVAEARSKGVAVVIATQTIQKLLKTYGNQDGKDIIGNTKCKVIFKAGEESDADYLSKTIGSTEVQRTQLSVNENASSIFRSGNGQQGVTRAKQIAQEAIFLPSDLMSLTTGSAVVLHPCAGETVAKLQFAPFRGQKQGVEFEPIREKIIAAKDFAKITKKLVGGIEQKKVSAKKKEDESIETDDDY